MQQDLKERKLATTTTAKPGAGTGAAGGEDGGGGKKKGGPLKLIIIAVVATLAVIGGGIGAYWYFAIRVPPPPPPREAGDVAAFEPISLNLADGHYLKLGISLQMYEAEAAGGHGKKKTVDGSKAMDAAIDIFSGRTMEELSDPAVRDQLKEELFTQLEEPYHHEVMDVYFTQFVMQ
jgi:flagellar FliL protein